MSLILLNRLLTKHLQEKQLYQEETSWNIQKSMTEGRGIFANRDIKPGEIIFIDHPVIIGPRARTNYVFHCVVCSQLNDLQPCKKGCGLPLCLQCEECAEHIEECQLIHKLLANGTSINEMSPELFRSLAPLRSLLLDEASKNLIKCLIYHSGKCHGFEVDLMKKYLNLHESDEEFLKIVCSVLDSNAFESVIQIDNSQISIRGLYPLSSILNHACSPNTTYLCNDKQQMIVKSTTFIPKGSEIFTTYTSLIWGTFLRRHSQFVTKHFLCCCNRCQDPKEFGTCLNGLKCVSENCEGVIYPLEPLNSKSNWKCSHCKALISCQNVGMMQSALGSLLRSICVTEIDHLIVLIKDRLQKFVPIKNHIAYELKLKVIWALGHNDKYSWSDLTMNQLEFKEQSCNEVLEVLTKLQLGMCKLRGLLLYELYRTRIEKCLRITKEPKKLTEIKQENKLLIKEAAEILENDITAPPEIAEYVNCL